MNNILIIDDREDFIREFINIAGNKDISVATEKSFEGLQKKMPMIHHKIAVVILDIKCLISDDQEIETEDFIGTAITYLDQNYPNFPRIILTGDDDSFNGYTKFNKNEEIFLKTPDEIEKLFKRVKYYCDNSENLKIKREYPEVFEIFDDGLMDSTQEIQVINILKRIDIKNSSEFKGILSNIRSVQEMIYKEINKKNNTIISHNMFNPNGMIKFNPLMKQLNGNPDHNFNATTTVFQNKTIFNLSNSLYWSCGEYIHEEPNRSYMISNMALKSLIYNLLELLIWAKQYLK